MPDIFTYDCPLRFLRDAWAEKKQADSTFTLRAWSKNLGLKGNAPLTLILQGKRPLPRHYLPRIAATLKLPSKESQYLENLLSLRQTRRADEQLFYLERLKALSPKKRAPFFEVESYKMLSDPLHCAILELSDQKNFKGDAKWIQARLAPSYSLSKIEESIQRLFDLGFLVKDTRGHWTKKHPHLSNRPDIADRGSQEYHRRVAQLAQESLIQVGVKDREFNSYAFNIQRRDLPRIKAALRKTITELLGQIEAPPQKGDELYQLTLQFFPLTKKGVSP